MGQMTVYRTVEEVDALKPLVFVPKRRLEKASIAFIIYTSYLAYIEKYPQLCPHSHARGSTGVYQ